MSGPFKHRWRILPGLRRSISSALKPPPSREAGSITTELQRTAEAGCPTYAELHLNFLCVRMCVFVCFSHTQPSRPVQHLFTWKNSSHLAVGGGCYWRFTSPQCMHLHVYSKFYLSNARSDTERCPLLGEI